MLAAAGIIVKILGAFFRIPLANIIGAYGMAVYQPAYSIYSVFVTFATIGLPVAISQLMISEKKVFPALFKIMVGLAVFLAAILFFFSEEIGKIIGIEESKITLMAIAPAIVFLSVTAVMRGYFQGEENMLPTSLSQIGEQLIRVVLGLILAIGFIGGWITYDCFSSEAIGAFGATLGSSIGVLVGSLIMVYFYLKGSNNNSLADIKQSNNDLNNNGNVNDNINVEKEKFTSFSLDKGASDKSQIGRLLKVTIGITLGAAIFQIFALVEVFIIVNGLVDSGVSNAVAISEYGQITGLVYPILNLPYIIVASVAIGLVPSLTRLTEEKMELGKSNLHNGLIKEKASVAITLSAVVGFPAAIGIAILGIDILYLLYPSQQNEITIPNLVVVIFGISVLVLAFVLTSIGILQGLGRIKESVYSVTLGIAAKIIVAYFLTREETFGIIASPVSTLIGLTTSFILLSWALKRKENFDLWQLYVKSSHIAIKGSVVVFLIGMCSKVFLNSQEINSTLATLLIIFLSMLAYGVCLFIYRKELKMVIKKQD